MKLIRFGQPGREKPGLILSDGRRVDATAVTADYDEAFFADGGLEKLSAWARDDAEQAPTVASDARLGPPVQRPGKIICIGLNFSDHASESNMNVPDEPVIFFKASSALSGPNDDVTLPRGSAKTDWEVELAVIIGKKTSYVDSADAMDYVAGYALHNDYSERAFQLERGGQWVKGKSCDTFAPLGPFLATPDEIGNVSRLNMWLTVNGELKQSSSTGHLIFGIPELVSYLSQFMSLYPSDIISTGTPAGVGLGQDPPQYLRAGDLVELGIDGLGASRQRITEPVNS